MNVSLHAIQGRATNAARGVVSPAGLLAGGHFFFETLNLHAVQLARASLAMPRNLSARHRAIALSQAEDQ